MTVGYIVVEGIAWLLAITGLVCIWRSGIFSRFGRRK
jgi:hypothetical protein